MRNDLPVTATPHLETRTYFRTLDTAMADFELPLRSVDRARLAVRDIEFEHVFIPKSREYIALEVPGRASPVAYVTPHYVALHPADGATEFVEIGDPKEMSLPESSIANSASISLASSATGSATKEVPRAASGARAMEEAGVPCPTCFINLPITVKCDWCN